MRIRCSGSEFIEHLLRQPARFGAEQEYVSGPIRSHVVTARASRRDSEYPLPGEMFAAGRPVGVNGDVAKIAVIETGARELAITQAEAERAHEMQPSAGIARQAQNVSGIRRDLGLVQNDREHVREARGSLLFRR